MCRAITSTVLLLVLGVGCEGQVGEPTTTTTDNERKVVCDEPPRPFPVRRLTARQMERTARSALGAAVPVPVEDERLATFPSNGSVAIDTNMASALGTWAFDVAQRATPSLLESAPCTEGECIDHLLGVVGRRLYRRPLEAESMARMRALYETVAAATDRRTAIRSTLEVMLQSPYFIYQVEHAEGPDPWSQLSRITFALWDEGPDNALLDRVDELADAQGATALVEDALADARFESGLHAFVGPWLMLEKLEDANRRTDVFATFDAEARAALRAQVQQFMWDAVQDGRSYAELFEASAVPAAPSLRDLISDDILEERDGHWILDPARRVGLLGLPGVLAANSGPESSSPTHRGVMVLTNLLCSPPQAPPPNVTTELPEIEGATTRQRLESHRDDTTCASCHESIDGIGFTFESYDWFGRYREEENGWPIDATGVLHADGEATTVADAVELSAALAQSPQGRECFAEMWLTYAAGRSPSRNDACLIEELSTLVAQPGGLHSMLVHLFSSEEFLRSRLAPRPEESE